MEVEFITTRELKNKDGEVAGIIRIMKAVDEDEATVKLTCPECGKEEQRKEKWDEPFVTGKGAKKRMHVACSGCEHKITVLKLKKQIKKEKDKEKRKRKK